MVASQDGTIEIQLFYAGYTSNKLIQLFYASYTS